MENFRNNKTFVTSLRRRIRPSLSTESVARILQVSSRTVSRWEEKEQLPKNPEQINRLMKLNEIIELGCQVYTASGLHDFLFTPLPVFKGKSAFQLLLIGEYDTVLRALAADYEGIGF